MSELMGGRIGRREFIGAAAAVGVTIVKPQVAFGSKANSAVRLGLLGCGGRGTGVTTSFLENTDAVVAAIGDMFPDQLEKAQKRLDETSAKLGKPAIPASRMFRGPKAYEGLFASSDVDAVYVATPPYFHPFHLEAALGAGKNIYLEKPVAVDVPGCKRVMELGKKAEGKVSFAVGFQIRHATPYVELVKRIHNGQIGMPVCGMIHYFASRLKRPDWPDASPAERRLRNWVWDRVLSGDIIVEQNVHIIDVTNWVLQGHPVKVSAAGGREGRIDDGDAWSHYNAVFTYPNDVHISFASTQFGEAAWGVGMQYSGSHGVAQANYDAPVKIDGETPWEFPGLGQPEKTDLADAVTGNFSGALDDADPNKQKAFIESVATGKLINEAKNGAEAALTAILGRQAARSGGEMTWDELLRSDEVYDPKMDWSQFA
jgi:myo-inositol 2-dehydrogenase/D-chiro-inositol 1-dehydrogenase